MSPANPGRISKWFENHWKVLVQWLIILILIGLLVVFFIYVGSTKTGSLVDLTNGAITVGVITTIAVGIERVLEGFWTILESITGTKWPQGDWVSECDDLFNKFDSKFNAFDDLVAKLKSSTSSLNTDPDLKNVTDALNTLKNNIKGNNDISNGTRAFLNSIAAIPEKFNSPDWQKTINTAYQAVDDLSDFIDSFKDNPGRKLISIYIGMVLGLLLAWALGLDLFTLTGNGGIFSGPLQNLGVAITGVVLGLGANPTHELVQYLSENKLASQTKNKAVP
jgi:hypothetical protein